MCATLADSHILPHRGHTVGLGGRPPMPFGYLALVASPPNLANATMSLPFMKTPPTATTVAVPKPMPPNCPNIYVKPANGALAEELLFPSDQAVYPNSWSRDGK